jgi:hypothetical protein
MMTVETAFDRIGSALRKTGYGLTGEEKPSASQPDRVAVYASPNMGVRIAWKDKARMLVLDVRVGAEWVEFARRSFGPNGLEETAVEALIRAVHAEVAQTSTDAG